MAARYGREKSRRLTRTTVFCISSLGAAEVIITDLPQLVGLMEENIRMNEVTNCRAMALTWGDDPAPFNPPFDVILIADVVCI